MTSLHSYATLAVAVIIMFGLNSCKKKNFENEGQLEASVHFDGRIEDQARLVSVVKHQRSSPVRGYHSDEALDTTKAVGTPYLMRTGAINFNGNSLFANMIDDTAWRYMATKWDIVNRAVAGSMWVDLYTHRDSLLFDYHSRQYVFYMGENEISYYINTRPTWTVAQLIANDSIVIKSTLFEFNRVYDAVRSKYPGVSILIVSPNHCPFHVSKGMTKAIDSIGAGYKRKITQDVAKGNKAAYIEMNRINDNPIYYKDSIHFKIPSNAYGNWAAKIKPYLITRTSGNPQPSVLCRIDSIYPVQKGDPMIHSWTAVGIKYNDKGNPSVLNYNIQAFSSYFPRFSVYYKYDSKNRLIEVDVPYVDPVNMENESISPITPHKFIYQGNSPLPTRDSILSDTFFGVLAGIAYKVYTVKVEDLYYDAQGRVNRIVTRRQFNNTLYAQVDNLTYEVKFSYDANGNRQVINDGSGNAVPTIAYTNKPSLHSLHSVWQLVHKDWSKNATPQNVQTFNSNGLPTRLEMKRSGFLQTWSGESPLNITYTCM